MDTVEIQTSQGLPKLAESAWMIFGPPKIGKSTFGSGWPNSIFLCTSKKEIAKIKTPFILVNTHKKLLAAVDYLIANRKKLGYKTIILDHIDAMYTNCETYICKKLKIEHPSEAGYGKGVGMIDTEFRKVTTNLISSGYGCLMISHMQIREIETMRGVVTKTTTSLPERARKIILPLVSVIGYLDFETIKVKDPETGKSKYKKRRVISFEPSEFLDAGDRDGFLPEKLLVYNDPKKTYGLVADYYAGRKVKGKEVAMK